MPELSEDMYCSQQIIVPPMFPYLLRQYAKAAIRSQPTDLLRWSTAYFRCLSLNLPPPIKPRLEYPIPKDYDGITPGWLRALLHQFQNNPTVNFKLLWDRWIGACLNHHTLIKILCLSGFQDPMAIPFLKFIGMCCSFISENLTQTMILVCEVMTEEPEGGSAMITVEVFNDVYVFLANIDASKSQIVLNTIFTDALLDLLEKKEKKKKEEQAPSTISEEKEPTPEPETVEEEEKIAEVKRETISCPDLVEVSDGGSSRDETPEEATGDVQDAKSDAGESEAETQEKEPSADFDVLSLGLADDKSEEQGEEEESEQSDDRRPKPSRVTEIPEEIQLDVPPQTGPEDESEMGANEEESALLRDFCGEGEKSEMYEDDRMSYTAFAMPTASVSEVSEEAFHIEEIEVEPIPGIGAIVPPELVEAVVEYMKACGARQHGMVMPRNIRHYSCPPLEVFD